MNQAKANNPLNNGIWNKQNTNTTTGGPDETERVSTVSSMTGNRKYPITAKEELVAPGTHNPAHTYVGTQRQEVHAVVQRTGLEQEMDLP